MSSETEDMRRDIGDGLSSLRVPSSLCSAARAQQQKVTSANARLFFLFSTDNVFVKEATDDNDDATVRVIFAHKWSKHQSERRSAAWSACVFLASFVFLFFYSIFATRIINARSPRSETIYPTTIICMLAFRTPRLVLFARSELLQIIAKWQSHARKFILKSGIFICDSDIVRVCAWNECIKEN